jgi:hypothetical protein
VFALGSLGRSVCTYGNDRWIVVQALERMVEDDNVPSGNWWSVGQEALAMLGALAPEYRRIVDAEIATILNSPAVSPESRRWAESYS